MNLKEVIETTDVTIGPSLWAFKLETEFHGLNPAAGHVYEVLGMADYCDDTDRPERACVIRGRSPIGMLESKGLYLEYRELFFVGPEHQGGGEPRAWIAEGYESFMDRFEHVPDLEVREGMQTGLVVALREKPWSVFRLR